MEGVQDKGKWKLIDGASVIDCGEERSVSNLIVFYDSFIVQQIPPTFSPLILRLPADSDKGCQVAPTQVVVLLLECVE